MRSRIEVPTDPRDIPGDFTFDSYFTSAKVLNHIQSTKRAYVGDLKLNRKLVYDGREQSLQSVARQIPWAQALAASFKDGRISIDLTDVAAPRAVIALPSWPPKGPQKDLAA